MISRSFTVWHRPRGKRKWRKHGEYGDMAAAAGVLFAEQARRGGDWKAIPSGQDPAAPFFDDE